MIFKRLNRTAAEQVFAVFKANEAGISADDVVALSVTGGAATPDGVGIEQPTATGGALLATIGIADAAIGNGAYGLVQIYGYRSTSRVLYTGASVTPGTALAPSADQDYLVQGGTLPAAGAIVPQFLAVESLASSGTTATASIKVFLRCM